MSYAHLWVVIQDKKIRCQRCEEIMTFSYSEYANEFMSRDRGQSCPGMPGPKPELLYHSLVEEY